MKSLKKALVLILSLLLVISALPFTAFAETTEVTDEPVNNSGWTAISTAEDFITKITADPDGNFYLTNDIDFGGNSYANIVTTFCGTLDGNGYALYNFKIDSEKGTTFGVFKSLGYNTSAEPNQRSIVTNLKIGKPDAPIIATIEGTGTNNYEMSFLATYGGNDNQVVVRNVDIYGECAITGAGNRVRAGSVFTYQSKSFLLDNVNFTGEIVNDRNLSGQCIMGGLVGAVTDNRHAGKSIIKDCEVNATLSSTNTTGTSDRIGGFVGQLKGTVLIQDCENNGNVLGGDKVTRGAICGYLECADTTASDVTSTNSIAVFKDCNYTQTDIKLSGYVKKANVVYAYNCKNASNNTTTNVIELNQENFGAFIAGINGGDNTTYPLNGFYRLTENIDLSTVNEETGKKTPTVYTNYVIQKFYGIFDGNDKTISGFALNRTSGDSGFFGSFGFMDTDGTYTDTAILDLTLGSLGQEISVTAKGGNVGTLIGTAGMSSGSASWGPIVSGITVYTDIKITTTAGGNYGGIVGKNNSGVYDDCKTYGTINVDGSKASSGYANVGGIVSSLEGSGKQSHVRVSNCINFADITVVHTLTKRVGGISGQVKKGPLVVGCANFGDITVSGNEDAVYGVGSILGHTNDTSARVIAVDCVNFSNTVTADNGTVGSLIGKAQSTLVIDGFRDLGGLGDTLATAYDDTATINIYDSGEGAVATMAKGASVRISEPTGIRFKAQCDPVVLGVIRRVADITITENDEPSEPDVEAPNITFGTIIAPKAFITGDFTKDTANYTAPADVVPFVDVPSNGNFKNVDGQIAGSLVGIDSDMKDVLFVGRAYVSFTVNGTAFTFYAAMNDNERSVANVADAALADLLYVKDEKYYTYSDGAYTEYTGADKTAYTETVGDVNADGYTVVSPYDADERVLLGKLLAGTATN